jgi:hypothetical protein
LTDYNESVVNRRENGLPGNLTNTLQWQHSSEGPNQIDLALIKLPNAIPPPPQLRG